MAKDRYQEFKKFCDDHQRLPSPRDPMESSLRRWAENNRETLRVKTIYEKYRAFTRRTTEQVLDDLVMFCETNERLPNIQVKEEGSLRSWMNKNTDNPTVKLLMKKYKKFTPKDQDSRISELKEFCETYGRLPSNTGYKGKEPKFERSIAAWMNDHRSLPEVKKILLQYRKKLPISFEEVKEFCEMNNRLPSTEDVGRSRGLREWLTNHIKESEVKELIQKYDKRRNPNRVQRNPIENGNKNETDNNMQKVQ